MADMTRNASEPRDAFAAGTPCESLGSRALEDAKEVSGELLGAVRDSATDLLNEQRRRASDEIVAVGEALRQSGEALDRDAGLGVGRYADMAARAIGDFADRVRTRSWSEVAADIEEFGRRWPAAFIATAAAIGFVGGRVLLSAPPGAAEPEPPRAMPGVGVAAEPAAPVAPRERG
jgi:ElaB/YqjD/DUF883 family membrane-anchored ribosome-binding protein